LSGLVKLAVGQGGDWQNGANGNEPSPGRTRLNARGNRGMADRAKDLQDMEDRVAKLLLGANDLPPGPERQDLLDEIEKFIARLSELTTAKQ
jgi:hypothetical protein